MRTIAGECIHGRLNIPNTLKEGIAMDFTPVTKESHTASTKFDAIITSLERWPGSSEDINPSSTSKLLFALLRHPHAPLCCARAG